MDDVRRIPGSLWRDAYAKDSVYIIQKIDFEEGEPYNIRWLFGVSSYYNASLEDRNCRNYLLVHLEDDTYVGQASILYMRLLGVKNK